MELGEQLVEQLEDLRRELRELSATEFSDVELGSLAGDAAAYVERALKTALPNSSHQNLNVLINRLEECGLPERDRNVLHFVRRAANRDKHEAAPAHTFDVLEKLLEDATTTICTLTALEAGLRQQVLSVPRRRLVVVMCDYFHTSETEYLIYPGDVRPDTTHLYIDVFQIPNWHEAMVEERLRAAGNLHWSPRSHQNVTDAFKTSEEFYRLGLFEGSYRGLVRAFRGAQHDWGLLGGLHRSEQWASVRAGVGMSVVDAYAALQRPPSAQEVQDIALTEYALLPWRLVLVMIQQILQLAAAASAQGVTAPTGPTWCSRYDFARRRQEAAASAPEHRMLIAGNGALWMA